MNFEIITFEELASTNDWLKVEASEGRVQPGAVVQAHYQSSGKGRLGRNWSSEPGHSLLFSVLLAPDMPESHLPLINLLISLGVTEGIEAYLDGQIDRTRQGRHSLSIRWPNDVLCDGKKLCGILSETCQSANGRRLVVAGIGINVNQAAEDFAPDLRTPAISLYIVTGRTMVPAQLLPEILRPLGELIERTERDGWNWIVPEWAERTGIVGSEVDVSDGEDRVNGRVIELLDDGAILIERSSGRQIVVRSGELSST